MESLYDRKVMVLAKGMAVEMVTKIVIVIGLAFVGHTSNRWAELVQLDTHALINAWNPICHVICHLMLIKFIDHLPNIMKSISVGWMGKIG